MPLISAPRVAPMLCCSPKKSLSSYVAAAAAASRQLHAARFVCKLQFRVPSRSTHTSLHLCSCSEVGALGRLRQLLVGGRGHVSSDLDEHGLHGEVAFPVCYAGELGEVDLREEIDCQYERFLGVVVDARDRRTLPLLALTQGRLTLLMKVTSGGESGY